MGNSSLHAGTGQRIGHHNYRRNQLEKPHGFFAKGTGNKETIKESDSTANYSGTAEKKGACYNRMFFKGFQKNHLRKLFYYYMKYGFY